MIEHRGDEIVISVEKMRECDARTITGGVPGKTLMFRAAEGVYRSYSDWKGKRIAIFVGGGNNGGDGYALAVILKRDGIDSDIITVSDKRSEDGAYYYQQAKDEGVNVAGFDPSAELPPYDVIVDCILGTGFSGAVRGKAREAIEAINQSSAYTISVDINSGMNGDTGEGELAVKSDLTVSVGFYKTGLFKGRAGELIGRLVNVDIGIELFEQEADELAGSTPEA